MAEYVVDRENVWPYGFQHEEVVRCRDCKNARESYEGMDIRWCCALAMYVSPSNFCCWGEPKEVTDG